jgi:two-component system, OmpR family, sensor kinase
VGHELRTAITVVRGHLELLDSGDRREVAETTTLVLGELDRMSRLVDDLVTLSSAERPDFLRPVQVDVGFLVDDVLEKARTLGDRAWGVESRGSAYVLGDPQRLTQALLALAHNAVKFTAPGGTVALGHGADVHARTVRVWVRDSGPGVRSEDAARIFRRRVRGTPNGPGTARGPGSGLGLAIVSSIAHAHGGRVELDSEPGLGATFTLVLPLLRTVDRTAEAWTAAPERARDGQSGRPARTRVGG